MRALPRRSMAVLGSVAVALVVLAAGLLLDGSAVVRGPSSTASAARSSGAGAALVRPAAFALGYDGVTPAAISLNWTATTATGFQNYSVFYSNVSATGPWRFVTAITTESTGTASVDNLDPGATYWWNVTAYASGLPVIGTQTAAYSTILQATQPTLAFLISPANTTMTINLSWTNNASYGGGLSFGSYAVEEVDDNVTSTYANLTQATETLTTVRGLTAGASYSFYIDTYDVCSDCTPAGDSVTQSNVIVAGTATPLTAAVTSTRTTVDARVLVGFTCTPSGGTPPYAFGWNFTNGTAYPAGPGTTSHAFDTPSATGYLVRCQVTDHSDIRYVPPPVTIIVNHDPRITASASPVNVTEGETVRFACSASRGTAPLSVRWTLGDGGVLVGSGDFANGTASYPSNGTFVAHCTATDAAGGRATAAVVIQVRAPPPFAWVTPSVVLASSVGAGGILAAVVGLWRRRNDRAEQSSAMSMWVAPMGAATVHGAKICPKCGASNVPLRRTCSVCGTGLPRGPHP